jgi:signal transduction histidine kinase
LINLVEFVIKHTTKGGETIQSMVTDKQNLEPTQLRFEIEDSVPGMQNKDAQRILPPFKQLEDRRYSEAGTGLGLSIRSTNQLKLYAPPILIL